MLQRVRLIHRFRYMQAGSSSASGWRKGVGSANCALVTDVCFRSFDDGAEPPSLRKTCLGVSPPDWRRQFVTCRYASSAAVNCSKQRSANSVMLVSRSLRPVSSVITLSVGPETATQVWPAESP